MSSTSLWLVVLLCTALADTADAEIAKLCELDGGYDISTLRRPPYWKVAIGDTSQCPGFKTKDPNCTVYFSFCQVLPNSNVPAGACNRSPSPATAASVCMVIGNQTDDPRIMGQYNKTIDPFHKLNPVDGRTAFEAEFPHGEGFKDNCTETITTFDFHCYPEADWDSATDNNVTQFLISAGFLPDNDCIFLMLMQYNGACVPIPATPAPPTIEVGWILIIILICLVLLYLIVGTVVNAIRGKRTAAELFPNFQFWKGFPFLLLDGVHFSLDLVTCYRCAKKPGVGPKYEQI